MLHIPVEGFEHTTCGLGVCDPLLDSSQSVCQVMFP